MSYDDVTDAFFAEDVPVTEELEKTYHANGMLKSFGFHRDGAPVGNQTHFFENGLFHKIIPYSAESRKAGVCVTYNKLGYLLYSESYDSSGLPHGVFHKLEIHTNYGFEKRSFAMYHGVPARWLSGTWWKDISIHWIHYKNYHMFLSFYRGGNRPFFSIQLYKRSPVETRSYVFYENKRFMKEFYLNTPKEKTSNITPWDKHYKEQHTPITIIYLEPITEWKNIKMFHGPYTDTYMADDILDTIKYNDSASTPIESAIRMGLERYIGNYGFRSCSAEESMNTFLVDFLHLGKN